MADDSIKPREGISQDSVVGNNDVPEEKDIKVSYQREIVWKNAVGLATLHAMALYGAYLVVTSAYLATSLWAVFLVFLSQIGVSAGAHRLYTHRSYQAKTPLRVFLLMCQTLTGQNCAYVWVRDHRQHHKYSDTHADPHNSTRGFFFSHIGWLMVRKHPDVIKYGKTIDMSDLEADPYVMFQKDYYKTLYFLIAIFLPVLAPCYYWQESLLNSFMIAFILRYVIALNATWILNSYAHMYGMRPYDKSIRPVEMKRLMSYLIGGEGCHNFHHAFPWDYRANERREVGNYTEVIIEVFEKLGLASNLRSASKEVVMKKMMKKGDGSRENRARK